jgi:hypothetical protein
LQLHATVAKPKISSSAIVIWVLKMQTIGLSITLQQLKLKVVEVTQTKLTPFQNNVPKTS